MPNLTPQTDSGPLRRGFTLTELMVSLVMFGIVSGIILNMVRAQQRFYRGATEVIDVRSQLRQAAAIMPLELRSVSTVSTVKPAGSPYQASVLGSDITFMDDKEMRFRSTYGSGVACQVVNATNTVSLAPQVLARLIRRGEDFAAAEDAVQEAIVEALRVWPEHPPRDPRGWLTTVATRRLVDARRSESACNRRNRSRPRASAGRR